MNIDFEKAIKLKLRFKCPRGLLTIEDLYDIPLTEGDINLEKIAVDLYKELNEIAEISFVKKTQNTKKDIIQLKFDIVKHIIDTRIKESQEKEKESENMFIKNKIKKIIEDKENEDLKNKSIDELKELYNKI